MNKMTELQKNKNDLRKKDKCDIVLTCKLQW